MKKDLDTIKGYNWGRSHIELELGSFAYEMRPIEVHLKEDGSLTNEPSMAIVMANSDGGVFIYGQLSLEMWNKALGEVGYHLDKTTFDANLFNHGDRINHFFVPILNQLNKDEIKILIDHLAQRIKEE